MKLKNYLKILFLTASLTLLTGFETHSQQIFATTASEVSEGDRVENVANAEADNNLFAIVNSSINFSGELKLEFPNTVPANSATYIKVDDLEKGLFDALLGGSLGDVLADAAGSNSIGDHYVEVTALDSSGAVVAEGSTNNFFNNPLIYTSVPLKVVKNKNGDLFISITPTEDYNAIILKDITDAQAVTLGPPYFTNVYHAFYLDPADTSCNSEEIFTSFDGTGITLSLLENDLGTGPTGVKDLEFAIDKDSITFSKIGLGTVSALASVYQDIQFSTKASVKDQLDISIRSKQGSIVNVSALKNVSIELFNKEESVFSTDLEPLFLPFDILPNEDGDITKISFIPGFEFDRLRVTLTSLLGFNLAQQVDLFSVKVTPEPPSTLNAIQSFCAIDQPTISDLKATATGTLIWYDKATEGTAYLALDALVNGRKYYAANVTGNCESISRIEVTAIINDAAPPTTTNTSQSFCAIDQPTIADLEADASGTITWYDQITGGNAYVTTDPLVDGTKYYATDTGGTSEETCESSERLEVSVTVQNPQTPTTTNTSQSFCATDNPTIADLDASITTGTIIWYDQATDGNAYNSADALEDGFKYYATNSNGTCEGSDRLEVSVTVQDPTPPTSTNTSQSFCAIDQPTIADLDAVVTNGTIIWYDQATDGNAYNSADALEDGFKYYATNSNGTCEGTDRLEVTVAFQNPETPTGNANQSFCIVDQPTIANLEADASGTIIWYDQPIEGTAYSASDALVDGLKYYAANSDGACESTGRLEVTVEITDTPAPTTTNTNQSFCSVDAPVISDLEATTTGTIVWYDQATNGSAYNATDALEDGLKYYASNNNGTCESSERLEVTVAITTAADITIQGNNSELCYRTIETYEVPTGYAPYTWSATGGEILSGGTSTDSSVEIEWTSLTDTKVSVSLTGGCFNANAAEQIVQVVVCSDLTIKNEVDFIKPTVEDLITFTIDVQNSSIYVFKDVNISQVLIDGFRYVSSNTSLGSYNESNGIWSIPSFGSKEAATLTIKAKVNTTGGYLNTASIISSTPTDADTSNNTAEVLVTPSCLEFYNIITPNEDGANDFFVISCIDNYKDTDLEIFDRYGSIIYKQRNYNNDWDGIANQTGKIIKQGQKLPSGTYFFVLKFNDGSTENIKSYIQIIR